MKNDLNIMVSEEIADQIDESQFTESEYNASEVITIYLESKNLLVPGIIEKYSYRDTGNGEELLFSFITDIRNIVGFQNNMNNFNKAKLMFGNESIGEYSLVGMNVNKIAVEQDLAKAGCVITVVYR